MCVHGKRKVHTGFRAAEADFIVQTLVVGLVVLPAHEAGGGVTEGEVFPRGRRVLSVTDDARLDSGGRLTDLARVLLL